MLWLGCDRQQARVVDRCCRAYFEQLLLGPSVVSDNEEPPELNNGYQVIIGTNSFCSTPLFSATHI